MEESSVLTSLASVSLYVHNCFLSNAVCIYSAPKYYPGMINKIETHRERKKQLMSGSQTEAPVH